MLARATRPCRKLHNRRSISYPAQVRAFPFKFSPVDAVARAMSPEFMAVAMTMPPRINNFWEGNKTPDMISAVWFPAWLVDAELEISVTFKAPARPVEGSVTAVLLNSYFPGHTMDKISTASFLSEFALEEAVPFSKDLKQQFGTDVVCLPFKTSPLALLDAMKRAGESPVDDIFRVDSSTLRTNLVAAYPILIPLYLMRFQSEFGGEMVSRTVIVEAHSEFDDARVSIERLQLSTTKPASADASAFDTVQAMAIRKTMRIIENRTENVSGQHTADFWYPNKGPSPFANLAALTLPPEWIQAMGQQTIVVPDADSWLDQNITPKLIHRTVLPKENVMDDPRIRPFTNEEVSAVRSFFEIGAERATSYAIAAGFTPPLEGASQTPQEWARSCDQRRQEATPSWWKGLQ
uniref:Uncharacterized protein n=1 Tax=Mycena chlorophos TaxID=658473 RepID=A0ABQ0MBS3_MYCCL|nr:predicted protein [Mycena chlorophos]